MKEELWAVHSEDHDGVVGYYKSKQDAEKAEAYFWSDYITSVYNILEDEAYLFQVERLKEPQKMEVTFFRGNFKVKVTGIDSRLGLRYCKYSHSDIVNVVVEADNNDEALIKASKYLKEYCDEKKRQAELEKEYAELNEIAFKEFCEQRKQSKEKQQ